MAGPVPTYLATQLAAQTAFSVPFGLLALVNASITTATAAGQFNTTVDCSLFTAEDVSNLRIYLDSEGYLVEFAKNSGNKSLLIDWGRFLDIPGTEIIVDQGTTPWIVAGTVTANQGTSPWVVSGSITTSPNVNIHDSAGNNLSSTSTSLDVNVTNFPATVAVTQSTSPWVVSGTVTALQGTSPWVVSGTVTTSPNVNVHDGAGNTISSTGTSLNVNVTDFPASQNVVVTNVPTVNQGTSPWVISGTVVANAGSGTFLVDGSAHTQPISAASLPLPAGASTAANQTTANTSLASIDSKTPALVSGRQPVDGSGVVQPITRVGATLNTNQISVGSVSTLIIAANASRKRLVLTNMGTTNVFIGNIGVTIGTGQLLLGIAGYVIPLYFTGAVYGIVGTGTQTIAYLEEAV